MTSRQKIPTIAEIQGRTLRSVRNEATTFRGVDNLLGLPGGTLLAERQVHIDEQSATGLAVEVGTSFPTGEENRRLRLAVSHIAVALDVHQDDLRYVVLTPNIITARVAGAGSIDTELVGRVLR